MSSNHSNMSSDLCFMLGYAFISVVIAIERSWAEWSGSVALIPPGNWPSCRLPTMFKASRNVF
jgi:hypothetical protein